MRDVCTQQYLFSGLDFCPPFASILPVVGGRRLPHHTVYTDQATSVTSQLYQIVLQHFSVALEMHITILTLTAGGCCPTKVSSNIQHVRQQLNTE